MKIRDIQFDDTIGLEGVEMLRKSIKSNWPSYEKSVRFGVSRFKNGKRSVDLYVNQPCHGILRHSGPFEFVGTGINTSMGNLYEYFVKSSMFSRFILNRDTYVEDKFIAVTGDLWYPFQNCLNIFCRSSSEIYGNKMEIMWNFLLKEGVPPEVAFFIACSTTNYQSNTGHVTYRNSHSLICDMTENGIRNFFSEDCSNYHSTTNNKPTIEPTCYEKGVYSWESTRFVRYTTQTWLTTLFNKHRNEIFEKRSSKKSLSPFDKSHSTNTYTAFTKDEFNEYCIPYLIDLHRDVNRIVTKESSTVQELDNARLRA